MVVFNDGRVAFFQRRAYDKKAARDAFSFAPNRQSILLLDGDFFALFHVVVGFSRRSCDRIRRLYVFPIIMASVNIGRRQTQT